MSYVAEISDKKQEVLVVDKHATGFGKILKEALVHYTMDVFFSPVLPSNTHRFDAIFLVNEEEAIFRIEKKPKQIITAVFFNKKKAERMKSLILERKVANCKALYLSSIRLSASDIEKILWFTFLKHTEILLSLEHMSSRKPVKQPRGSVMKYILSMKGVATVGVAAVVIYHLLFFPFLLSSTRILASVLGSFRDGDTAASREQLATGLQTLSIAQTFYNYARPTYHLFSTALGLDNQFAINQSIADVAQTSIRLNDETDKLIEQVTDPTESDEKLQKVEDSLMSITRNAKTLHQELDLLSQQESSDQMDAMVDLSDKANVMAQMVKQLFSTNQEKTYLVLMADDQELRPGGGVIQSYAILTIRNKTIVRFEPVPSTQAVPTIPLAPPEPLQRFLKKDAWSLRDVAFSESFPNVYAQAKFFLSQEVQRHDFSGGILITTAAMQNILDAMGGVYVPELNDRITASNIYIQSHIAEQNGQVEFTGAVMKAIFNKFSSAPLFKVVSALQTSLDEKQLAFVFDDSVAQTLADRQYWSGKIIEPRCVLSSPNCVVDFIFPSEANVGKNKADAFIKRSIHQTVVGKSDGSFHVTTSYKFVNQATADVFPGGKYQTYLQFLLPPNSRLKRITQDGTLLEGFDQPNQAIPKVGFYLELAPNASTELLVEYDLGQAITSGSGVYQLIAQKQLGAPPADFILEMNLPNAWKISTQNFAPVVKDNRLLYNTTLTGDKLFILQLTIP